MRVPLHLPRGRNLTLPEAGSLCSLQPEADSNRAEPLSTVVNCSELLHGSDTGLDVIHICHQLVGLLGGGWREEVALVDGDAFQPVFQPVQVRI